MATNSKLGIVSVRLTDHEVQTLTLYAKRSGYATLSGFIRATLSSALQIPLDGHDVADGLSAKLWNIDERLNRIEIHLFGSNATPESNNLD
jgi:hypothetical protein